MYEYMILSHVIVGLVSVKQKQLFNIQNNESLFSSMNFAICLDHL